MRPARCWRAAGRDSAKAAIGTGFTLPPLSTPMPSVQPWFRIPADRLADTDRDFLDTVNPVLSARGPRGTPDGRRHSSMAWSDSFTWSPSSIIIRFDPATPYLGAIEPTQSLFSRRPRRNSERGVFVYLSATNRFLEPVLNALKAREVPVDAYIAGNASANIDARSSTQHSLPAHAGRSQTGRQQMPPGDHARRNAIGLAAVEGEAPGS